MRVVIAGDSLLLRKAVVRLLEDAGIEVAGEARSAADLVRKVHAHRPDVAILDIRSPSQLDEGLQATGVIRAQHAGIGVLLLAQRVDECYAAELLEHGAEGIGYLLEDRIDEVARFVDAVGQVAEGRCVLDPEIVSHVMTRRRRGSTLEALGDRERQVLAQMARGASNRAIARRMFLCERAIERSVTCIFDALKISASRTAHRRVLAVLAYLRAS